MTPVPPLVTAHVVVGLVFRGWHVVRHGIWGEQAVAVVVGALTDSAWSLLVVGSLAILGNVGGDRGVRSTGVLILATSSVILALNLQLVGAIGFPFDPFVLSYVAELGNVGFVESLMVEAPMVEILLQVTIVVLAFSLTGRSELWPSRTVRPRGWGLGVAGGVIVALAAVGPWIPRLVIVARADGLNWAIDQVGRKVGRRVGRSGVPMPSNVEEAAAVLRPSLPVGEIFGEPGYPLMRGDPKQPCSSGTSCVSFAPKPRPDLIIVQMESLPGWVLEEGGGIGPELVAPVLAQVARRPDAWFHPDFESNSSQTSRGLAALLCSVWPHHGPMLTRLRPPLRCLPQILAEVGYTTQFIMAGDPAFDHQLLFAEGIGFQRVEGERDVFAATGREVAQGWGAADELLFLRVVQILEEPSDRPRLVVAQTIGNHHPYVTPGLSQRDPEHPAHAIEPGGVLSTSAYADWSLAPLVAAIERAAQSGRGILVVLTGDNGHPRGLDRTEFPFAGLTRDNVHTPLVVWAPGTPESLDPLRKAGHPPFASTVDILPTLLGLLRVRTTHASVGIDLGRQTPTHSFATVPASGGLIRLRTAEGTVQVRLFPGATTLFDPRDVSNGTPIGRARPEVLERLTLRAMALAGAMNHLIGTRRIWPSGETGP